MQVGERLQVLVGAGRDLSKAIVDLVRYASTLLLLGHLKAAHQVLQAQLALGNLLGRRFGCQPGLLFALAARLYVLDVAFDVLGHAVEHCREHPHLTPRFGARAAPQITPAERPRIGRQSAQRSRDPATDGKRNQHGRAQREHPEPHVAQQRDPR